MGPQFEFAVYPQSVPVEPSTRRRRNLLDRLRQCRQIRVPIYKDFRMHVTMRWYQSASALGEAMVAKSAEVQKIIEDVPGFIAYYAIRSGDTITSVTVCQDKAGTDETTKRAAAWVKENVKGSISPPAINEGDTFLSFTK